MRWGLSWLLGGLFLFDFVGILGKGVAPRRSGYIAGSQEASRELRHGNTKLIPQAALQAAVILRAAEDVADQIAKRRRVVQQLHHAGSDGASQKIIAKDLAGEVGCEFEVAENAARNRSG